MSDTIRPGGCALGNPPKRPCQIADYVRSSALACADVGKG